MYIWNDIKIDIGGNHNKLISLADKYLNADKIYDKEINADIHISIFKKNPKRIPDILMKSKLIRSIDLEAKGDLQLKIYERGKENIYAYGNIGKIWLDLFAKKIVSNLESDVFSFPYYNLIFFFFSPLARMLGTFGYEFIHSSCIDINGRSIIFTGQSGRGKSTSAFSLIKNGANMISDDLTFLKKQEGSYYAYSINRLAKLDSQTMKDYFPEFMKLGELENEENEIYIDMGKINKNKIKESRLSAIVIIEGIKNNKTVINNIHPIKIIPHLLPGSIKINDISTEKKFNFLTKLIDDIPCYSVKIGKDMADFYKEILSLTE